MQRHGLGSMELKRFSISFSVMHSHSNDVEPNQGGGVSAGRRGLRLCPMCADSVLGDHRVAIPRVLVGHSRGPLLYGRRSVSRDWRRFRSSLDSAAAETILQSRVSALFDGYCSDYVWVVGGILRSLWT